MGTFINIGNTGFLSARNSEYVDKSGLISVVNSTLNTERRFSCVTRCRRFGKSMAAKMLCAYYDQSCNSKDLFSDLRIASDPSFEKHLNKYPVISVDMTNFVSGKEYDIIDKMDAEILADISKAYPDVPMFTPLSIFGSSKRSLSIVPQSSSTCSNVIYGGLAIYLYPEELIF